MKNLRWLAFLYARMGASRFRGFAFFILAISLTASWARADTIDMTGNLTSDGTAVSSTDPVITTPGLINYGDPFSMVLTYDPTQYTLSGTNYVLTDATFVLSFDGYAFDYSSATGSYISMSTPGAYGAGTVSFQICTSASCLNDYIDLYYSGTVSSLGTLSSQASGLSGYTSASPSEFEFSTNFSDGSQTDLQGTLNSPTVPSSAPEPSLILLLGINGLIALGCMFLRRRRWRLGQA